MNNITNKLEIIRDEGLKQTINAPVDMTRTQDSDNNSLVSVYGWVRGWTCDPNWLNYGIVYNNKIMKKNCHHCPKLLRLIRNLMKKRYVVMAGYYLLKSRSKIPKHTDQKDNTMFDIYHIGLSVPDPKKCLLGVGKTVYNHKDGELICFDDRIEHWAVNASMDDRLIFYIKCTKV